MSLTPLTNILSRISPQIFAKIWNDPNEILKGPGDTDLGKKTWSQKSSVRLPFSYKWGTAGWGEYFMYKSILLCTLQFPVGFQKFVWLSLHPWRGGMGGGSSAVRTPCDTLLYPVKVTQGLVYIIAIFAPMIYTALCVMRAASITRASGRGLGPWNRDFFGPCEMASSR